MGRVERLTRELQKHDRELYANWIPDKCIAIYRKSKSYEAPQRLDDGSWLRVCRFAPHFVFALTDTWTMNGERVDWGIEPVMARIRAMDLWNRDVAGDLIHQYKKDDESAERDGRNNIESFLYEFRGQFAKSFKDVNTSNLNKIDNAKRRENAYRK